MSTGSHSPTGIISVTNISTSWIYRFNFWRSPHCSCVPPLYLIERSSLLTVVTIIPMGLGCDLQLSNIILRHLTAYSYSVCCKNCSPFQFSNSNVRMLIILTAACMRRVNRDISCPAHLLQNVGDGRARRFCCLLSSYLALILQMYRDRRFFCVISSGFALKVYLLYELRTQVCSCS